MTTIGTNFNISASTANIHSEVARAAAGDSSVNIHFLVMKLGMATINLQNQRLTQQMQDMSQNVIKMEAANELKANLQTLIANRTKANIADGKTMENQSADTSAFAIKAQKAGISMSSTELTAWGTGAVTEKDIAAVEARVKTMQDSATNLSQSQNMQMQMINTNISQFTNMAMGFLDELKKLMDRVLR